MKRFISQVTALGILFAAAAAASAELVSLSAVKDNTLYENASGALSNGAGEAFFAGRTNQFSGNLRRALIAFDIDSQLPAGVTITNVTLRLYCSMTISGPQNIGLHRLTRDWGESTSDATGQEGFGAGAAPGDATWIHNFRPGSFWTTPGGDFAPAPSATTAVDFAEAYYTWSDPQMILDVQSWLDNPSTDFGWLLRGNEAFPTSAKRFNSRQNGDSLTRPVLIVEYVPEPASLLLLLAAAPLIRRGRR